MNIIIYSIQINKNKLKKLKMLIIEIQNINQKRPKSKIIKLQEKFIGKVNYYNQNDEFDRYYKGPMNKFQANTKNYNCPDYNCYVRATVI